MGETVVFNTWVKLKVFFLFWKESHSREMSPVVGFIFVCVRLIYSAYFYTAHMVSWPVLTGCFHPAHSNESRLTCFQQVYERLFTTCVISYDGLTFLMQSPKPYNSVIWLLSYNLLKLNQTDFKWNIFNFIVDLVWECWNWCFLCFFSSACPLSL